MGKMALHVHTDPKKTKKLTSESIRSVSEIFKQITSEKIAEKAAFELGVDGATTIIVTVDDVDEIDKVSSLSKEVRSKLSKTLPVVVSVDRITSLYPNLKT